MAPFLERILNQRCVKPTVGASFASPWDKPVPVRAKSAASPLGFTVRVFNRGPKCSKQICGEKYVQNQDMMKGSPSPELRPTSMDFGLFDVHKMLTKGTDSKVFGGANKPRNEVLPKGVAPEWDSVETFSKNGKSKRRTWDQQLVGVNKKLQETKVNTTLWSLQTQTRMHEVVVLNDLKDTFHAWRDWARTEAVERKRKERNSRASLKQAALREAQAALLESLGEENPVSSSKEVPPSRISYPPSPPKSSKQSPPSRISGKREIDNPEPRSRNSGKREVEIPKRPARDSEFSDIDAFFSPSDSPRQRVSTS